MDKLNEQMQIQGAQRIRWEQRSACRGWLAREVCCVLLGLQEASNLAAHPVASNSVLPHQPWLLPRAASRCRHSMRPDEAFGLLFNFDNVVANTRQLQRQAWQAVAAAEGLPFPSLDRPQLYNMRPERAATDVLMWTRDWKRAQEIAWLVATEYGKLLLEVATPLDGVAEWLQVRGCGGGGMGTSGLRSCQAASGECRCHNCGHRIGIHCARCSCCALLGPCCAPAVCS